MPDMEPETRAARNQAMFRAVNEKMRELRCSRAWATRTRSPASAPTPGASRR